MKKTKKIKKTKPTPKSIAALDKEIKRLIKARLELSEKIGKKGIIKGIKAVDKKYDEVVRRSKASLAEALEIEANFVGKMLEHVISFSKKAKKKLS